MSSWVDLLNCFPYEECLCCRAKLTGWHWPERAWKHLACCREHFRSLAAIIPRSDLQSVLLRQIGGQLTTVSYDAPEVEYLQTSPEVVGFYKQMLERVQTALQERSLMMQFCQSCSDWLVIEPVNFQSAVQQMADGGLLGPARLGLLKWILQSIGASDATAAVDQTICYCLNLAPRACRQISLPDCAAIRQADAQSEDIAASPPLLTVEDDRLLCKVCFERPLGITFEPCGHFATCGICYPALRHCPICRSSIHNAHRTILP